jgi:hypothetical protein
MAQLWSRSMSPILSISEPQFLAILNAANALDCSDRDQFVAAVYAELRALPMLGDGTIGRTIRAVQVSFPHPEPDRGPQPRPKQSRDAK